MRGQYTLLLINGKIYSGLSLTNFVRHFYLVPPHPSQAYFTPWVENSLHFLPLTRPPKKLEYPLGGFRQMS